MMYPESVSIDIPPKEVPEKQEKKKRSLKSKILRILLWILIFLLALTSCFFIYTLICNSVDEGKIKKYSENYSKKVEINGRQMSYSIVGENNNQTIALIPGMGSPSPIIEFKPLAEALSDRFKVISIEPFGYGFSDDIDTKNRDLDTVISEIRDGIKKLGIDKYYVMGHSMGGLFSLQWANQYSEEVLGVVSLDGSVPGTEKNASKDEFIGYYKTSKFLAKIGMLRLFIALSPSQIPIDSNYPYTKEEIDIEKLLIINHTYTNGAWDDIETFFDRLINLGGVRFPDNIPSLTFLSGDNVKATPEWEPLHHDILGNNTRNEITVLDGPHYIHYPQKDAVAKKIKEWIQ